MITKILPDTFQALLASSKQNARGIIISILVSGFSIFVSSQYGGPAILYALLAGLSCSFLGGDKAIRPGLDFCSRFVLRLGVAFLGARVALDQLSGLGLSTMFIIWAAMGATFLAALLASRPMGLSRDFALLSATATAVCGVSAALTAASILPRTERSDRDTAFVALSVTLMSTAAMLLYPIIISWFFAGDTARGVFLGASIHDVAQVVAAGYLINEGAANVAVVTKLARVSMLIPVSISLSLYVGLHKQGDSISIPIQTILKQCLHLPWFLLVFTLLAFLSSVNVLPTTIVELSAPASKACLVLAISAIGVKTGVSKMLEMGLKPTLFLIILTIVIALAAITGLIISGEN